jgi:hypothetical protein
VTVAPSAPAPPPTQPAAPALQVPGELHLAGTFGTLPVGAAGDAVTWTIDTSPGLSVSLRGGVVVPGQVVQVQVLDPLGTGGWLYISYGGTTIPVEVTSDLGAPAAGLP